MDSSQQSDIDKLNAASESVLGSINESLEDARKLPDLIGNHFSRELQAESVVNTKHLGGNKYEQDISGVNAPIAARLILAMLTDAGVNESSKSSGKYNKKDRIIKFTLPQGKSLGEYAASAEWLAANKETLRGLLSVSNIADQVRERNSGSKIYPEITSNGISLRVQTNEGELIKSLDNAGFTSIVKGHFRTSDMRDLENAKQFEIPADRCIEALNTIQDTLGSKGIAASHKKINFTRSLER